MWTNEKQLRAQARWRNNNRNYLRTYNREKCREFARWMDSLKKGPCVDCRKKFPPYVMDWDHVRGGKAYPIAALRRRWSAKGRELVLAEIKKCDLVCSNCHRIRTHKRDRRRARRQA